MVAHSAMSNKPGTINAIAEMHELQADIAAWAKEYEAGHVFMGERPNVTVAAIRGGDPWRLSRNPYSCSLYLDIRTVPGQTTETVKRGLRRVLTQFAKRKGCAVQAAKIYLAVALDLCSRKAG
jgi:acetylornithine deacetylase